MLIVDAANVVGSRPNGWWRDRGKAAADLCRQLVDAIDAKRLDAPIVAVLEGAARRGVDERDHDGLRVVHSPGSGDDTITELVARGAGDGQTVTVVTADRELRDRTRRLGAHLVGPTWLLDRLESRS